MQSKDQQLAAASSHTASALSRHVLVPAQHVLPQTRKGTRPTDTQSLSARQENSPTLSKALDNHRRKRPHEGGQQANRANQRGNGCMPCHAAPSTLQCPTSQPITQHPARA